jgi:hypothetical protein
MATTSIVKHDDTGYKLPSINEIYTKDDLSTLQKDSAFQVLLNQEPKKEWLKSHPTAKIQIRDSEGREKYVPLQYIPIQRIEWLLVNIFLKYRVEIKSQALMANSIVVTVRLHYYDHIANEWHWQDGIGASPLQTDKGAGAIDFNNMKSHAVMLAAPAAESYAVKDAAEKIGKLFGKDLNRADAVSFDSLKDKYKELLQD